MRNQRRERRWKWSRFC